MRYSFYFLLWCVNSDDMYVIEIKSASEPMWVANWEGDPPRTLRIENAQIFPDKKEANKRIKECQQTHPFREVEYNVVVRRL